MPSQGYEEVSPWVQTPPDLQPWLTGDVKADVVIIGGGFSGLTSALALREAGVDVAIVEMDYCGMGASGRNAGHLTPTIGKDFPTLTKVYGKERGVALARFADRAVEHTEELIARYAIECEYAATGNVVAGVHERHRKPLQKGAELAQRLGVHVEYLDDTEVARRRLPGMVKFGVLEKRGGHLHPGKYVMGLRAAALAAGVRIFEQSKVIEIRDSASPIVVRTASGSVTADKLVLATNAYTPETLGQKSLVLPLRVTQFRTAPLSDAQWARIGWDHREGIYTAHESLENFRPQANGTISGGSKMVQYGYGSTLPDGDLPKVFEDYRALFARRFPEIADVPLAGFWGGWIAMTLDTLPINRANKRGTVVTAMGYNGHGIAQASYAGTIVADQILGQPNQEAELLRRRMIPLPPEPLRWLLWTGLFRLFESIDRKVDRDLEAAAS